MIGTVARTIPVVDYFRFESIAVALIPWVDFASRPQNFDEF
jgi:hypothetical protein